LGGGGGERKRSCQARDEVNRALVVTYQGGLNCKREGGGDVIYQISGRVCKSRNRKVVKSAVQGTHCSKGGAILGLHNGL